MVMGVSLGMRKVSPLGMRMASQSRRRMVWVLSMIFKDDLFGGDDGLGKTFDQGRGGRAGRGRGSGGGLGGFGPEGLAQGSFDELGTMNFHRRQRPERGTQFIRRHRQ